MEKVVGDLIQLADAGEFDVIVHGCNCYCRMNSGIAKAIRARFPGAWQADQQTKVGDASKLGTYTCAIEPAASGGQVVVVNAYTQFDTWSPLPRVKLDALRDVFVRIKQDFSGKRIGYPLIGAGLAGGNWADIAPLIEAALAGENHRLVVLP